MGAQNRIHFTKAVLDKLPIPKEGERLIYYDDDKKGLGIRVTPTNQTFFLLKKVRGRTVRVSLGTYPDEVPSPERARVNADGLTNELGKWKDSGYEGESPIEKRRKAAQPVERGLTFGVALDRYIKHVRKESHTPDKSEKRIRWFIDRYAPKLKVKILISIEDGELDDLHTQIGNDFGKIAANRTIEIIRAVFYYGIKRRWCTVNPAKAVEVTTEKPRKRFLMPDELVRFSEALDSEPNRDAADFFTLLLATGVRKSELAAALWSDVHEQLQNWTVPITKTGDSREVNLKPKAVRLFESRRERKGKSKSLWVFPSQSGSGHIADWYKRSWYALLKRAELENITMHDLRRTYGSYQALAGNSLQMIGESLGHKSLESTAVYARLMTSAARQSILSGDRMMETQMRRARLAAKKKQKRLTA